MKNLKTSIMVVVGFFALVAAGAMYQQVSTQSPEPTPPKQPVKPDVYEKMFGGGTTKDFGIVPKGKLLRYTFKITNTRDVPAHISSVRSSCPPVPAKLSKYNLMPNETADLTIAWESSRFNGARARSIFVTFSGPEGFGEVRLDVQAYSMKMDPAEVNFGVVARGATPNQSMSIYEDKMRFLAIVTPAKAPYEMRLEKVCPPRDDAEPFYREDPKPFYRIQATIKPDAAPGPFQDRIQVKTDNPTFPVLTLSVSGKID